MSKSRDCHFLQEIKDRSADFTTYQHLGNANVLSAATPLRACTVVVLSLRALSLFHSLAPSDGGRLVNALLAKVKGDVLEQKRLGERRPGKRNKFFPENTLTYSPYQIGGFLVGKA